jgi:hypothetical protein
VTVNSPVSFAWTPGPHLIDVGKIIKCEPAMLLMAMFVLVLVLLRPVDQPGSFLNDEEGKGCGKGFAGWRWFTMFRPGWRSRPEQKLIRLSLLMMPAFKVVPIVAGCALHLLGLGHK